MTRDARRKELLAEHRALKAEHAELRAQRPINMADHKKHTEQLRLHQAALQEFFEAGQILLESGVPPEVGEMPDSSVGIDRHLDDLESEIETGSRHADAIGESLSETQFREADAAGTLAAKLDRLRASVRQQRDTLRIVRLEIAASRDH